MANDGDDAVGANACQLDIDHVLDLGNDPELILVVREPEPNPITYRWRRRHLDIIKNLLRVSIFDKPDIDRRYLRRESASLAPASQAPAIR